MERPTRRTGDATKGLSGSEGTNKGEKLVGGGSHRDHCGSDGCGHTAVTSREQDVRCGHMEERGASLCTPNDREAWTTTATAIPEDGRLHSARSERRQRRRDWWLTSAPDGAHGAVHAAWLH